MNNHPSQEKMRRVVGMNMVIDIRTVTGDGDVKSQRAANGNPLTPAQVRSMALAYTTYPSMRNTPVNYFRTHGPKTRRLRGGRIVGVSGKLIGRCLLCIVLTYLATSARAAGTANADITLNVTSHVQCTLTTGGLTYNFTSLTIGKGSTLTGAYSVSCDASTPVTMNTIWDGKLLTGSTYTFSNKDTVEVEYCYRGSATQCWPAPNNTFTLQKRDLDLRLTYTANGAEKDVVRKGTLQLTYD